jgi:two-component system cell cycle response regulator DivK
MDEKSSAAPKILVVDDYNDNLVVMSLSLQSMGYRVVTATNGEEAVLVAVLAHPDLILMDISMPQLDGFAAARRIHENDDLKEVPIIAVTAFATEGFQQAAFDAGFKGYLVKPVDYDKLQKLIAMLLTPKQTSSIKLRK